MDPTIPTALSLLVIGMLTVFAVLTLVVVTGKLLISIVNSLSKEVEPLRTINQEVGNRQVAAITVAIESFTKGRGSVQKIEKL